MIHSLVFRAQKTDGQERGLHPLGLFKEKDQSTVTLTLSCSSCGLLLTHKLLQDPAPAAAVATITAMGKGQGNRNQVNSTEGDVKELTIVNNITTALFGVFFLLPGI